MSPSESKFSKTSAATAITFDRVVVKSENHAVLSANPAGLYGRRVAYGSARRRLRFLSTLKTANYLISRTGRITADGWSWS